MVIRGNPQIGAPGAPVTLPTDARRDMLKELIAARLVAELASAEGTLKDIVQTGERGVERTLRLQREAPLRPAREGRDPTTPTTAQPPPATREQAAPLPDPRPLPASEQVQRALQNIQRDAGLPITGRFDDATAALLVKLGLVQAPQQQAAAPKDPAGQAPPKPAEPAPTKKPIDPAAQQSARQALTQREQLVRARVDSARFAAGPTPPTATRAEQPPPPPIALDRVLDPARLLASLVAAGFKAPTPTQALQSFQASAQLPPTGQLDKATLEALVKQGVVSPEAASAHQAKAASDTSSASASSKASDGGASKAGAHQSAQKQGSGAQQQAQVTRAPASSPEEARELARLESLLAQAAASERGVQEAKGDPAALAGHGAEPGQATGITGSGAAGGGADHGGDEASVAVGEDPGEESSVGNSDAGDDDYDDDRRGEASDALNDDEGEPDDPDGLIPDGHYRVVALSEQVTLALETITRLDDDHGPTSYTWDVTLYRPGVYADQQPAEAVWHLVVDRAHAFDPVWQRATDAIAARLLYIEPDALPPSLDDVLAALRRARVREPSAGA